MKRMLILAGFALVMAGCIQTKSEVDVKPIDVNLNLSGTVNLNVTVNDARKDMQQMQGAAPTREVKLQDLGYPAPATQPGAMGPVAPAMEPVLMVASMPMPAAREDDLKNNISGRIPQVRYLLDAHVAGETHTGLLLAAPGATLSVQQAAIMTAENADRGELYSIQAQQKGVGVDAVGLSFYVARLGYAKQGDWYEKYNKESKATNKWEWSKWPN